MLRERPQGEELRLGIVSAVDAAVFACEHDRRADLSDADKYLAFFKGALEFVTCPHVRRPQYVASFGIRNRMLAWQRVVTEARENVGGGDWMHADCLGALADTFARTFALMGNCRFAL